MHSWGRDSELPVSAAQWQMGRLVQVKYWLDVLLSNGRIVDSQLDLEFTQMLLPMVSMAWPGQPLLQSATEWCTQHLRLCQAWLSSPCMVLDSLLAESALLVLSGLSSNSLHT